jgi:hypothetical protein
MKKMEGDDGVEPSPERIAGQEHITAKTPTMSKAGDDGGESARLGRAWVSHSSYSLVFFPWEEWEQWEE